MSDCDVRLVDSLEKVYGLPEPRAHATGSVVLPRKGVASFQIAIKPPDSWSPGNEGTAIPTVTVSDGLTATAHAVDFVPCSLPALPRQDQRYDHVGPALLPDVLRPLAAGEGIRLAVTQWRSVWVTVRSADVAGESEITVTLRTELTNREIGTVTVPVTVVDVALPDPTMVITQWFHVDGIAQYYDLDPYSDRGWQALERFVGAAVDSGSTSILTPIHTPPLDTAVGTQRLPVGLVGITRTGAGYEFEMSKFLRWLEICERAGVKQLEMAHLFSQWGGLTAPNIHDEQGNLLFGWDTDSLAEEYHEFLASYIPAVRATLAQHWPGTVFWHVTDEPHGDHAIRYRQVKEKIAPLLEGCVITDALSDLELWTSGLIDPPIVSTDHAQSFVDAGLAKPWIYYCTGQSVDVSNRFISMPSYRNRVLGWQLFGYDCSGFLHWGFNFYNTQVSRSPLNPFLDTSCGDGFQSGDGFIVYPGPDGVPWDSIRLRVFREAMDDARIFTALAERDGRDKVVELLGIHDLTLSRYPDDPAFYLHGYERALRALATSD